MSDKIEMVKVRIVADRYRLSTSPSDFKEYKKGDEIEVPRAEVDRAPWVFVDLAKEKQAAEKKSKDQGTMMEWHLKQREALKAERLAAQEAMLINAEREAQAAQERLARLRQEAKPKTAKKE
jgi:hypothetical protein